MTAAQNLRFESRLNDEAREVPTNLERRQAWERKMANRGMA